MGHNGKPLEVCMLDGPEKGRDREIEKERARERERERERESERAKRASGLLLVVMLTVRTPKEARDVPVQRAQVYSFGQLKRWIVPRTL